MSDMFEISATWRHKPPTDGRDVAELRLAAGGVSLTRLSDFDRKEERDFVRGSAVSLALWLADNWWRLRYESLPGASAPTPSWRLCHELTSASGGTLWPPIMIHSTGGRVLLGPSFGRPVEIGAIRYILPEIVSVEGGEFESGLDQFFDLVLGTCAGALDADALEDAVEAIRSDRDVPEIHAWRRIEARLGYDSGAAPPALMRALGGFEQVVGKAGLDEAAAASPGSQAAEVLGKAVEAARASQVVVDLRVAAQMPANDENLPPWQLGRKAASKVRELAGIGAGPVRSRAFADLVGATSDELKRPGTARKLPYSSRIKVAGDRHQVALHSADPRDRRFELSCALADEIWMRSEFGVMSKAKTDRQKFQRAFAQNLLVPVDDLRGRVEAAGEAEFDIKEAARYYHVHPNVVRRLLILEGIFPQETLEERLEAA